MWGELSKWPGLGARVEAAVLNLTGSRLARAGLVAVVPTLAGAGEVASTQSIHVIAWNVESGGSSASTLQRPRSPLAHGGTRGTA